eukprot:gene11850-3507_t
MGEKRQASTPSRGIDGKNAEQNDKKVQSLRALSRGEEKDNPGLSCRDIATSDEYEIVFIGVQHIVGSISDKGILEMSLVVN